MTDQEQKRLAEIEARCAAANQPYPAIRIETDAYPWVHDNAMLKAHAKSDISFLLGIVHALTAQLEESEADRVFIKQIMEKDHLEMKLLTAQLAEKTAEAEAAKKDIRDMLYESRLMQDDALCSWCVMSQPGGCAAYTCKGDAAWRGMAKSGPAEEGAKG